MDKKAKLKGLLAFLLILIALGAVGYLLYIVFNAIIFDLEFDFFTIIMLIVVIALPLQLAVGIIKGFSRKTPENPINSLSSEETNETLQVEEQIKTEGDNASNSLQLDPWGKSHKSNPEEKTPSKPKPKAKPMDPKKIIPLVIFIAIIIVLFVYQSGGLSSLGIGGSSNPVGRWIYDMEVGEISGGIENLTDYWYMDFSEGGTVEIGIKNDGFAEMSQGSGTWSVSNGVIHVVAEYNWGTPLVLNLRISGNQLIDDATGDGTGYFRE